MKYIILFVILAISFTSCNRMFICGMGSPRTDLKIIDDSVFIYQHYAGIGAEHEICFSKGRIDKIGRKKYKMNSFPFYPIAVPYNIEQSVVENQNGFAIKISTDLYEDFFRFNRGTFRLIADNNKYDFNTYSIDTLFQIPNIENLRIEFELNKPDIVVSKPHYRFLKTENIKVLNGMNRIEISIPFTSEEFDWIDIENWTLVKTKNGYLIDDFSIQVEKTTTYNNL